MSNDLKNIIVFGNANDAEFILIDNLMKNGYRVKSYDGELMITSYAYLELEKSYWKNVCSGEFFNEENLNELIAGCDAVICCDYLPSGPKVDNELSYNTLKTIVDISKRVGIQRYIYICYFNLFHDNKSIGDLDDFKFSVLDKIARKIADIEEYLKESVSSDFIAMTIKPDVVEYSQPVKKCRIQINTIVNHNIYNHKINILYPSMKIKTLHEYVEIAEGYRGSWYKNFTVIDTQILICIHLIKHPLDKILNVKWPIIIFMKMFLKRLVYIWGNFRTIPAKLFRLKDVFIMMILFHVWPEQVHRFSTRKLLPSKKGRYFRESRPVIPFDLLKSESSRIKKMKEINLIGRGSSFDLDDIKSINGPKFLVSFWSPINSDNDDVTYVIGRKRVVELFKKMGLNVLCDEVYGTDKDDKHFPLDNAWGSPSFLELFDNDHVKRISIAEKIYRPPILAPHPCWAPTGSFLPGLCALSYFAEKINVYGWDFYLNSSPEEMSYWQLFFNLYKYGPDVNRSRNHFESAIINFYYGYHLSKLPNINIHGYLGQLGKHEKLIKRIERVLFNIA